MATLLNSRNQLLNLASTRIVGAGVYITSGVATALTLPTNATATLPTNLTLTAIPSRYVVPQYTWYRRFNDTGNYVVIPNSNNPVFNIVGDAAFIADLGSSTIVQYKVEVIETTTTATNPSEAVITIPIVREGTNAVLGVLTNSSQEVSVGETGEVPAGTVIESTLLIYNGAIDDSANWSATIVASAGVLAELVNGKTIKVNLPLSAVNGYVDITATRQGYADIVKRFSISKTIAASAISIVLSKDTHVFNANSDGVVSTYSGASTNIFVYSGPNDSSNLWTISVTAATNGVLYTLNNNALVITSVPDTLDVGNITITASRAGFPNLTKTFDFAKAKDAVTYNVIIESSNGDTFRPGNAFATTLVARVFKNDQEVTSEIPASRFRWTRVSYYPQPPPADDSTWNQTYSSGYKSIVLSISDVWQRATFHCDILE
jgi:hypothetical protein